MPHVVMEYSNSIEERVNVQALLEDLHQVTIQSDLFEVSDIKSRMIRIHHWLVGDLDDSADFIHITLELLEGRNEEQKNALAQSLMSALQEKAEFVESLTVNIRDMDRSCFQKVTNF
ncbi:5-carboxymethyl-2-hydroxymuconate Delta-isomerase [Vibrio casei]|uniref:5-carboxymethyl-2-hydroxymuconate Delta-isomerase n=1 Tax=Vibrio casei TaxID=673372 RepID=A0A368LK89_9VIBR|nr:5-carboxymethyl-2-hydroxymuconate Delta-isomerase [Vibrio casei]RCS72319.1 5-carboxymethyl-2-hydroxymuconate Delta-isomerase [Vibrio casei]SJN29778.1 5-carboxymethyl-2-hydroxymuconate delta-isomerase [Vibrio casei]